MCQPPGIRFVSAHPGVERPNRRAKDERCADEHRFDRFKLETSASIGFESDTRVGQPWPAQPLFMLLHIPAGSRGNRGLVSRGPAFLQMLPISQNTSPNPNFKPSQQCELLQMYLDPMASLDAARLRFDEAQSVKHVTAVYGHVNRAGAA